jgi:hypothetical protein
LSGTSSGLSGTVSKTSGEALLRRMIVSDRDRLLVVQHQRRVGEIQPVPATIRGSLSGIPLELHWMEIYAQLCIRTI